MRHLSTYSMISLFILFHRKYCLKSLYILVLPGCTEYQILWTLFKICFLIYIFLGRQRRLWNHKVPSLHTKNLEDFSFLRFCFVLWCLGSFSWFTGISSTIEGCKVGADSWTVVCPCDTNWTPKSSGSFRRLNWVIATVFKLCYAFILKSSTTTFVFPGWY